MDSFNGDFQELAEMMRQSWAENEHGALLYTEAFLRSALQQPGTSLELCPAMYENGKLLTFAAGFPRQIQYAGTRWKFLLVSLLTVASEAKGRMLAGVVWNELAERARLQGFDGLINLCVEGEAMNVLLPWVADRCGLPTKKVFTVTYMARPVPKDRAGVFEKADAEVLLQGSERINRDMDLGRVWTAAEAAWQCDEREGAFGCRLESEAGTGTISAYTQSTADGTALCGLVDDIVWGDLGKDDQKRMVGKLLDSASAAGANVLLAPVLHYTDMSAFAESGFRKTRRALNVYLTSWRPEFELRDLTGAYIDVL